MNKKYDDLGDRIKKLKSARDGLTSRIGMYNYYTRGLIGGKIPSNYNSLNPMYSRSFYSIFPEISKKDIDQLALYPIKCDTTAETIVSDGVSSFVSASLPEGIDSIEVEFFDTKYRNYLNLNVTQRNLIADLGGLVTKILHYLIKKPEYCFMSRINTAIANYIEYGFAAIRADVTEEDEINIVNFTSELTFFDFEISRGKAIPTFILLGEKTNDSEIKKKYPGFIGSGDDLKSKMGKENTIWYYYYREKDLRWTCFIYDENNKETLSYKTSQRQPAIFIANREIKSGVYGIGDGISSLSTILDLNTTTEGIKRAVNINTNPPIIIDENAQTTFYNDAGEIQDGVDTSAGGKTNVRNHTNTSAAKDAISLAFGGNHIDIAALYQIMEGAKNELRQAFSADLFSPNAGASEQTATEINTRTSQSLHRFKGKANNLYSELLIPLVKGYVSIIINDAFSENGSLYKKVMESQGFEEPEKMIAQMKDNFTIKILSFGEQLRKDQELQNSLQYLQVLMGLQQQSQQLDPEVTAGMKKLTITMLENLNKSTSL